jgi:hypothetical protein
MITNEKPILTFKVQYGSRSIIECCCDLELCFQRHKIGVKVDTNSPHMLKFCATHIFLLKKLHNVTRKDGRFCGRTVIYAYIFVFRVIYFYFLHRKQQRAHIEYATFIPNAFFLSPFPFFPFVLEYDMNPSITRGTR